MRSHCSDGTIITTAAAESRREKHADAGSDPLHPRVSSPPRARGRRTHLDASSDPQSSAPRSAKRRRSKDTRDKNKDTWAKTWTLAWLRRKIIVALDLIVFLVVHVDPRLMTLPVPQILHLRERDRLLKYPVGRYALHAPPRARCLGVEENPLVHCRLLRLHRVLSSSSASSAVPHLRACRPSIAVRGQPVRRDVASAFGLLAPT